MALLKCVVYLKECSLHADTDNRIAQLSLTNLLKCIETTLKGAAYALSRCNTNSSY